MEATRIVTSSPEEAALLEKDPAPKTLVTLGSKEKSLRSCLPCKEAFHPPPPLCQAGGTEKCNIWGYLEIL